MYPAPVALQTHYRRRYLIGVLPTIFRAVAIAANAGAACLTRTDDLPLTLPLRLSPPIVCGLDYPLAMANALGPPRLVSTPSCQRQAWLGIGIAVKALAFPEFEGFYSHRFR